MDEHLSLALAGNATNDTLGPEGLLPLALVFGEYPRTRTDSKPNPVHATVQSRADLATAAWKEIEYKMTKLRVHRAMAHAVPLAAARDYQPGDKFLVWCEKQVSNHISGWLGAFEVTGVDYEKKLVFIRDTPVGPSRPFNVVQVKHYFSPELTAHNFVTDIAPSLHQVSSIHDDVDILATEVLDPADDRAMSSEMSDAKKK